MALLEILLICAVMTGDCLGHEPPAEQRTVKASPAVNYPDGLGPPNIDRWLLRSPLFTSSRSKRWDSNSNRTPKESLSLCDVCQFLMSTVHWVFERNLTDQCLGEVMQKVCIWLNIEKNYVCEMLVSNFKHELLYVIGKLIMQPKQVCGLLIDECGRPFNPIQAWNSTIPPGKPPPTPWRSPQAGAPSLRVLHISDIHFDPKYLVGSEANCTEPLCCRKMPKHAKPVTEAAGYWGTSGKCDIPIHTLENLLQNLSTSDKFDYILWTGDLEPHNIWNYTRDAHLAMLQNLTDLFLQYFPKTPIFAAVGNHEGVPVNSFPPHSVPARFGDAWLYDALAEQWRHWLPSSTLETIRWRASYSVSPYPGLRILSVNTQYCDATNFWLYLNSTDPDGTLEWLISQLLLAESKHETVHIIGHIPSGDSECLAAWSANYYRIVNRFESTIRAQFFGHTHYDSFQIYYDNSTGSQRPTSFSFVAPSLTTYADGGGVFPAYRVYTIDGSYSNSTWAVLDHETFYLNTTEANFSGEAEWQFEYRLKDAYEMDTLFPSDWHQLSERLLRNDTLFHRYLRFYRRKYGAECDWRCRRQMVCQVRSARSFDKRFCKDFLPPPTPPPPSPPHHFHEPTIADLRDIWLKCSPFAHH